MRICFILILVGESIIKIILAFCGQRFMLTEHFIMQIDLYFLQPFMEMDPNFKKTQPNVTWTIRMIILQSCESCLFFFYCGLFYWNNKCWLVSYIYRKSTDTKMIINDNFTIHDMCKLVVLLLFQECLAEVGEHF